MPDHRLCSLCALVCSLQIASMPAIRLKLLSLQIDIASSSASAIAMIIAAPKASRIQRTPKWKAAAPPIGTGNVASVPKPPAHPPPKKMPTPPAHPPPPWRVRRSSEVAALEPMLHPQSTDNDCQPEDEMHLSPISDALDTDDDQWGPWKGGDGQDSHSAWHIHWHWRTTHCHSTRLIAINQPINGKKEKIHSNISRRFPWHASLSA